AAHRRIFSESALQFIRRYDLDGLDLDWEYPGQPGAGNPFRAEDGANFTRLLQELRARFDAGAQPSHRHLLLTIAAGASLPYLEHTQMREAQRYLDQINLMAYDFYEPGESAPTRTGNHAPLFADPADPLGASADRMVQAFEQAGVPAAKLVLGVPFYGHAWKGVAPENHGLFQTGSAAPGLRTGYTDVQALLAQGFTRYWDQSAQVPWAYNSSTRQFISYEDPESLTRKAAYILQQHLGGVMFWQYFSDPSGVLLRTLHTAFASPATSAAGGRP
ncbi:MAG: glycoside hydrolase, partial [Rhodospirillales bacterium]|nr:glycoside hydrolase [Acetobacter sp.]